MKRSPSHLVKVAVFCALLWSIAFSLSAFWNATKIHQFVMDQAYAEARVNLNKDISFRRWGSLHGGVYVPITSDQQPVEWLAHMENRDVETTKGQRLTLLNPATMMRQLMDEYAESFNVHGRITGFNSINPSNAPDHWETKQLLAFEEGERSEAWDVTKVDGESYLRFLRKMDMEPNCVQCHSNIGANLGAVAGAIGVNLGLTAYYQQADDHIQVMLAQHSVIWLLGLMGIALGGRSLFNREQETYRYQQRFQTIFQQSMDGIVLVDPETHKFVEFNQKAHQQLGYDHDEFEQLTIADIEVFENVEDTQKHIERINQQGWDNFETQHRCKDGSVLHIQVSVQAMTIDGKVMLQSSFRDITARIESQKIAENAQQLIREERDRGQLYLDTVQSLMVALDTAGNITMINAYGCKTLGYDEKDLLGKNWFSICLPPSTDLELVHSYFDRLISEKNRDLRYFENEILKADGSRRLIAWRNSLLYDDRLQVRGTLSAGEDITERKAAEQEVHSLAFYDVLTGLPNRRLLKDRLRQSMADAERNDNYKAMLFMDLDNFKNLNDTLGHDLGDQLLIETAKRIQGAIRDVDTVSRHGGDEFIVLLEQLGSNIDAAAQHARTVAESIITHLRLPYELNQQIYQGSVSIGITMYRGHNSHDKLMKRADLAMYQAKNSGRNCFRFFDPEMQASISLRTEMEHDLRKAIQNKEFELYYQPQVDADGHCVGVEALIRWHSPERGFISPAEFIPIAEDSQLILPIGRWVIEQACKQLLEWQQHPSTDQLTLAVNVSAVQFKQEDFTEQVTEVVVASGINATRLKLEITESMLVDDMDAVIAKMTKLKRLGISFSLDDFGTGYSSLSYVKLLPLDQLKIDQSFVRDVLVDPNDAAICKAVIALGESLGLHTIAEGVEQPSQWEVLKNSGCKGAQGYLYARPMAIDDFTAWLQIHIDKEAVSKANHRA